MNYLKSPFKINQADTRGRDGARLRNHSTQRLGNAAAIVTMIFGNAADGKAAQLTMSQQLEMYRNCVIAYKDYSARFADRMCSCTVGAYMRNIPAEKAWGICYPYANEKQS